MNLRTYVSTRALSEEELYRRSLAMLPLMQQATANPYAMLGMLNYCEPVSVPQGWQDWYAVGDQLH